MNKQIPPYLFGIIIVAFTAGFIGLLGSAMKPASQPASGLVAQAATDFSGKTADGKTIRLSDYKGKVVLVNFWATWCGPCRMEIPDLVRLQNELGPKGFQVIGLSGDDTVETAATFAKANKMPYPIILNTPDIMKSFGSPQGIPASFLINKEGNIVWAQEGIDPQKSVYAVLKSEIEQRL